MFGRNRSRPLPYTTYLLPSFPSLSWRKRLSAPPVITVPSTRPADVPEDAEASEASETSEASSIVSPRESIDESDIPPHRYSLASTTSTASASSSWSAGTVTTTATAPSPSTSLSTSPCSLLSTTSHSLSSATLPVSFPAVAASHATAFLETRSAEPDVLHAEATRNPHTPQNQGDTGVVPKFALGPQVGPSVCPRPPYPGRAPPTRRLQRVLPTTLRCRRCSADLAFASQIVSKSFTGRHGRAYLMSAPSSHANHLFAPEVKALHDEDTLRDNDERGAIWEETGVNGRGEPHEDEDEDEDEEEGEEGDSDDDDGAFASGLVRDGSLRDLPNIRIGRAENRRLVTGTHIVADISCAVCCAKVGWKYIDASDDAQRYKVGKFILELAMLATHHSWEDVEETEEVPDVVSNPLGAVRALNAHYRHDRLQAEGDLYYSSDEAANDPNRIEFDSDDDEECEEIFKGTWNAETVARRRAMKRADVT